MVVSRTSSSLGRSLAEEMRPWTEFSKVERLLDETTEGRRILDQGRPVPLGGIHDIRPTLRKARIGSMLQPSELLDLSETIVAGRRLRNFLLQWAQSQAEAQEPSVLADPAHWIQTFPELERSIAQCISDEGQVRDQASPALSRIRSQLRTLQNRVRERLDQLVRSLAGQRYLQESIITVRGGRYVVPVKQEHKASVPGLVHDQSSSGATLFIEPMAIVELNNLIREQEAAEGAEVERILRQLTDDVAAHVEALWETVNALARLDFVFARACLSQDLDAERPKLNKEGWIDIRQGRHPLLTGKPVPIDLWLGRSFQTLVITGPNTGGKTVTLKTAGLFVLMAQAGLHVPGASGTELGVFTQVFADIGDEQSIEQSLSTFSSHLTNIVRILQEARPGALVLFDELGAGTDPTEGSAIAMAILEHVTARGCRTIATTHYSELKSFAYATPNVENASVEFDVQTLRPTYRLAIGLPGKSNAFAIAGRLGLEPGILEKARLKLQPNEARVEDLIAGLQEDRRVAAHEREMQVRLRRELDTLKVQLLHEKSELNLRRTEILEEARQEARRLLLEARREAERLIAELRRTRAHTAEQDAQAIRKQIEQSMQGLVEQRDDQPLSATIPVFDEQDGNPQADGAGRLIPLVVGETVRLLNLNQEGLLLELTPTGEALVQVGALRVSVAQSQVLPIARAGAGREATQSAKVQRGRTEPRTEGSRKKSFVSGMMHEKALGIGTELDLRGLTADEALERVDKYLDDALLAGLGRVRIIHGKGTGALREAIRRYLVGHPSAAGFRLGEPGEGGDGVTVIELRG